MSVFKKLQDVFDINQSTLSGCVDIIATEQPDGSLKSSSFHVRFGKFKVLKSNEKVVTIKINDIEQKVHMKMDSSGKAYFEDIRDEAVLDRLMNQALSSDDGFSDYDCILILECLEMTALIIPYLKIVPYVMSDDEGGFDKEKLQELFGSNLTLQFFEASQSIPRQKTPFRFDDVTSPQKDTKTQPGGTSFQMAQPFDKNEKIVTSSTSIEKMNQKEEVKGGFNWFNIFGGRKKNEEAISNHHSRKNSDNLSNEELSKIVYDQTHQQLTQPPQTQSAEVLHHHNSNHIIEKISEFDSDKSPISAEGTEPIIHDLSFPEKKQDSSKVDSVMKLSLNVNREELPKNFSEMEGQSSVQNCSVEQADHIAKKEQLTTLQFGESKIALANGLANSQLISKFIEKESSKEQSKEQIKIDLKDLIDQKKDLKELIAANRGKSVAINEKLRETYGREVEEEEEEDEEEEGSQCIGLSLCNNVTQKKGQEKSLEELFEEYKVTYEQFSADPLKILNDKNLLLKIGYHLYPWEIAASILISRMAFNKELPEPVMQGLIKQQKKKQSSGFLGFLFRRDKDESVPSKKSPRASEQQQQAQLVDKEKAQATLTKKDVSQLIISPPEKSEFSPLHSPKSDDNFEQQKYPNIRKMSDEMSIVSETSSMKGITRIKKVYKPKSDILKSFNLKEGANKISFTVQTTLQGEQMLEGYIYFWPKDSQIVISDIDGTITKSDMLGQIMPMLDKDWTHEGVVELFQNIVRNGYKILYLTARAIGQSDQTRKFIYNVKQGNQHLPLGPVIMSSDRLFKSFKREIIDKKPEVFKIAVLREIQGIFSNSKQLYFAGFGNRETDCLSYRAVQVKISKIYITNPAGELHQINTTSKNSYPKLNEMVNEIFPPLRDIESQPQQTQVQETPNQELSNKNPPTQESPKKNHLSQEPPNQQIKIQEPEEQDQGIVFNQQMEFSEVMQNQQDSLLIESQPTQV